MFEEKILRLKNILLVLLLLPGMGFSQHDFLKLKQYPNWFPGTFKGTYCEMVDFDITDKLPKSFKLKSIDSAYLSDPQQVKRYKSFFKARLKQQIPDTSGSYIWLSEVPKILITKTEPPLKEQPQFARCLKKAGDQIAIAGVITLAGALLGSTAAQSKDRTVRIIGLVGSGLSFIASTSFLISGGSNIAKAGYAYR